MGAVARTGLSGPHPHPPPAVDHSEVKLGGGAGWELGDRDWGQPLAFRHTHALSPFTVSMIAAVNGPYCATDTLGVISHLMFTRARSRVLLMSPMC